MNRREFLTISAVAGFGALAVTQFPLSKALAEGQLKLIDMKSKTPQAAQAKGLGYVADLKKALADKKMATAAGLDLDKKKAMAASSKKKPEEQTCASCNFYTSVKEGQGKCTLIQGVLVHGPGSCNTWVPKA